MIFAAKSQDLAAAFDGGAGYFLSTASGCGLLLLQMSVAFRGWLDV